VCLLERSFSRLDQESSATVYETGFWLDLRSCGGFAASKTTLWEDFVVHPLNSVTGFNVTLGIKHQHSFIRPQLNLRVAAAAEE